MTGAAQLGLVPHIWVLSVKGRRTGRVHSTPVRLIEDESGRFLVAPYGVGGWVPNVRRSGEVTLNRRGSSEVLRTIELGPLEAAPVLRKYLIVVPIVRPYFDVNQDSTVDAFIDEAPRHPVFRLER